MEYGWPKWPTCGFLLHDCYFRNEKVLLTKSTNHQKIRDSKNWDIFFFSFIDLNKIYDNICIFLTSKMRKYEPYGRIECHLACDWTKKKFINLHWQLFKWRKKKKLFCHLIEIKNCSISMISEQWSHNYTQLLCKIDLSDHLTSHTISIDYGTFENVIFSFYIVCIQFVCSRHQTDRYKSNEKKIPYNFVFYTKCRYWIRFFLCEKH